MRNDEKGLGGGEVLKAEVGEERKKTEFRTGSN